MRGDVATFWCPTWPHTFLISELEFIHIYILVLLLLANEKKQLFRDFYIVKKDYIQSLVSEFLLNLKHHVQESGHNKQYEPNCSWWFSWLFFLFISLFCRFIVRRYSSRLIILFAKPEWLYELLVFTEVSGKRTARVLCSCSLKGGSGAFVAAQLLLHQSTDAL